MSRQPGGLRVVAIVQARVGSTRLPGKVLMDVAGEPMLARVMSRLGRARTLDESVVATTMNGPDDAIASLSTEWGWPVFRGEEHDVLDRYYRAAKASRAGVIVRVTSDCPMVDPAIVDKVVHALVGAPDADYASTLLEPRTFPRGLDVEAMTMGALGRAWEEDTAAATREHVTPYIYRHPDRFALTRVASPEDLSQIRWTVDEEVDLRLIRTIYEHFDRDDFTWREALDAYRTHPEWGHMNEHTRQKEVPESQAR